MPLLNYSTIPLTVHVIVADSQFNISKRAVWLVLSKLLSLSLKYRNTFTAGSQFNKFDFLLQIC